MSRPSVDDIIARIEPLLTQAAKGNQPVVLMTCGLAGSGKSTLAKAVLVHFSEYERLSIDEIIFKKHGLYGVDYPANEEVYQAYLQEAGDIYMKNFQNLLTARKNIILDRSFYAREDRNEFRAIIEAHGSRRVLAYLRATDKKAVWQSICERSVKQKDANSAYDINRKMFEMYWSGFEDPAGEDEIVLNVL
ncbi:hypothetical protein SCUP515_08326 [Seiridium cupressi]